MAGFCHQLITITILHVLNHKYFTNVVKYTGYVFTGSAISFCIWGLLISLILNPFNLPKSESYTFENGAIENYFPYEVSRNFPKFCFLYASFAFVISFFVSFNLSEDFFDSKDQFSRDKCTLVNKYDLGKRKN
jgi:hypothetical protein